MDYVKAAAIRLRASGGGLPLPCALSMAALLVLGRGGEARVPAQEVLEKRLHLQGLEWLTAESDTVQGAVTLIRWWTDHCPFCANSLPLLEDLQKEYGKHGLRVVAVYHPKPPHLTKRDEVLGAARRLGYTGPVARDADWAVLRRNYLDRGEVPATSVSFLLDREGRVRYVHPGPDFWPGRGDGTPAPVEYLELRAAIERLLATRP